MRNALGAAVACLSLIGIAAAEDAQAAIKKQTNIPAQSLGSALETLARERSFQIVFVADEIEALATQGVAGELTVDEALTGLLKGSGHSYRYVDEKTVTILPMGAGAALSPASSSSAVEDGRVADAMQSEGEKTSFWNRLRLAQSSSPSNEEGRDEDGQAPSSDDASGGMKLEEVIVTATKRAESVQDVPMSIAVISGEELERRGAIGMQDYLRSVPGVTQIDNGLGGNAIIMRGTATETANPSFFSGVTTATFFGETSTTGSAGLFVGDVDIRPVDLERVEVLRGPQGTTFGSSALGGAVRLIPAKPDLNSFSVKATGALSATGGYGSENSMLQGVVNVPIVEDKFALRFVGYDYDESGFYQNIGIADPTILGILENSGIDADYENLARSIVPDEGAGRVRSTGGRVAALWEPTDDLDIAVNYLTQRLEQDGKIGGDTRLAPYLQAYLPINPTLRVRGRQGDAYTTELDLLNVVLNYDMGWATLTSIGSWVEGGTLRAFDFGTAFGVPISASSKREDMESRSGEIRLASNLSGPFQFLGGLYYEKSEFNFVSHTDWAGSRSSSPFTGVAYAQSRDYDPTQKAVFGEASYEVIDNLTLTAGGRYFDYETSQARLAEGFLVGITEGTGVPTDETVQEDGSTYMARLGYEPNKDTLVYLSWAEGFRMGRPQGGLPPTCDADNDGFVDSDPSLSIVSTQQTESDTVESYELGGKFSLFERRLRVDVAVYRVDWENMPVTAFVACSGAPAGEPYTANAGSVTSEGVELQASLSLTEGLRFDFGLGYNDAQIAEDIPAQQWVKGMPTPGSPEWNANVAVQYDFDAGGLPAFIRSDVLYVGEFYDDVFEAPTKRAGDYIKVDARAGVELNNLSVELFVRNLTDEDAITTTNGALEYRLRPRTVGIQLGYKFQ